MTKLKPKTEPFYRVPKSVYDSFAFRSLSHKATALFHHMLIQFNGRNNGNISATLNMMRRYGWASSATLSSAIKELMEHGLLKKTRQGGMGAMKQCSLYAFTHLPVAENTRLGIKGSPATHEYRNYTGGKAITGKPVASATVPASSKCKSENKVLVRNTNGAASISESQLAITDSDFMGCPHESVPKLNAENIALSPAFTGQLGLSEGEAPTVQ